MKKVKVIDKNSIKSIKYERELLSKLHHPFIVNMYYSFQDYEYLYLIMDLLNGGDLRYHVSRHKKFTEEQTSKKIIYIKIYLFKYRIFSSMYNNWFRIYPFKKNNSSRYKTRKFSFRLQWLCSHNRFWNS